MTIDLETLEAAAAFVHRVVPPTPQYCWPLLSRRVGAEFWVKHENHTPIGAFKIRGGLIYLDAVRRSEPNLRGVVTATTGNHGQSIALAATRLGIVATIVAPYGNSIEKNRAKQLERIAGHTAHQQRVIGRDKMQLFLLGELSRVLEGRLEIVPGFYEPCAEPLHRPVLLDAVAVWHNDRRIEPQPLSGKRNALSVIAGGRGHDTANVRL